MIFSRQELYWGKKNQSKISKAKVTIIGCGALGSISAELLCRAGIGGLTIIDRDSVDASNLHRQVLYEERDIGKWKAEAAAEKLKKINSGCKIVPVVDDLNHENISRIIRADYLLDCTDNLYTRHLINEYCKKEKIPWVHSSCIRDYGNVMAIVPDGPCFSCVFGDKESRETCDTVGVLNTAASTIASIAVTQLIRLILEERIKPEIISYNVWNNTLTKINPKKRKNCGVCMGDYDYLSGKHALRFIQYCGGENFQFMVPNFNYENTLKTLSKQNIKKGTSYFFLNNMFVFKDGRIVVKAKNEKQAKALISKYFGV
ncbi:MAG TPA: HesA/MoeB/ThiF family protein [Candidatus Nanoarchaeia archaeon]|nr:HesA/MoeB/ThiF family protein [Candidatus Nanoarchaeia archaeon]